MISRAIKYPRDLSGLAVETLSLNDLLRLRASRQPDQLAYTFFEGEEIQDINLTYAELEKKAKAIAVKLQGLNIRDGKALLLYPPGLEFIAAFFGCSYAGLVAVPAYPARNNRGVPRLQAIVKDAQARVVLTTSSLLSKSNALFTHTSDLKALYWLPTDAVEDGLDKHWRPLNVSGDSLAFIQYTSGSTGTPKGVMLTHNNLLHNANLVYNAVEHTPYDKYVSWLPTFHDMGFMAGVLQPLYAGLPVKLMSPLTFLQRPVEWLKAISRYKATTSGAPNFAYDLCVRKITSEQRAALDLSSWTVAFNGAEPIRAKTIDVFVAAFEECGFRRESFFPCYGLAEATLIVSGSPKCAAPTIKTVQSRALKRDRVIEASEGLEDSQPIVGCGRVLGTQTVAIVNNESLTRCLPGVVGEIWVSGASIAKGYWSLPEETKRTFHAYISGTGEGPFLRTGDLGFLLNGELYVTGRHKDLIIIRGQNHYPQDIEWTVERCHSSLRLGCGAAFSIDISGEERLVVVQEIEFNHQSQDLDTDMLIKIRQAVIEDHEIQVYAIVIIKPGTIPKTSSGKIQRQACMKAFLGERLDVVAEWRATASSEASLQSLDFTGDYHNAEDIQSWLASQLAMKVGLDASEIDVNEPVTRYGIDSLQDVELVHSTETDLGITLPVLSFLQGNSIAEIASQILAQLTAPSESQNSYITPALSAQAESPLSYGQQSIWFMQQLAPESPSYNIGGAARLRMKLDVTALQCAFQTLIDRHPSLRTSFASAQGAPVQRVREHLKASFETQEASHWSEDVLKRHLTEEAHRPIDLEQGALLRVKLFTRSDQEHVLLLTIHHIVADLWSLAVLLRELGVLYDAEVSGNRANLPELELHHTDYVRWQSEMLAGPRGDRLWAYWQEKMAGELPALNLPTDRPRPPVQMYRGASQPLKLSRDETRKLKSVASQSGATVYMILLAAFQSLLHRYTGQEDILVGSPTSNRSNPQLDLVVGYFVNPVVMRASLSGDPAFKDFLLQVRETVLAALDHQDYPFPLLVERLQPDRDPSRSPLFQAMFVLQKTPLLNEEGLAAFALGEEGAKMQIGGLMLESIKLEWRMAHFDLTLMMAEASGELIASLQYNAGLFEAETIERMAEHFHVLLQGIIDDPGRRISELPMLTPGQQHQLLLEWNDSSLNIDHNGCIQQLFEAQVERAPDAVAVMFGHDQITYSQLNNRANQLAHHLRALGVGPDIIVAICLDRSIEMIVALLGVIKAGGAYLPLDPNYPKERLSFMLDDAEVGVLLSEQSLIKCLPQCSAETILLDTDWQVIAQAPDHNPPCETGPENLVYVIYTSGSTGKPKAVMVEHRSLANLAAAFYGKIYARSPAMRISMNAPLSFDASVKQWVQLLYGCTLCVLPEEIRLGAEELNAYISAHGVEVLDITPSQMRVLLGAGLLEDSATVPRVVLVGGETIDESMWAVLASSSEVDFYNVYGPTECTDVTTCFLLRESAVSATIGRQMANVKLYVLDKHLNPMPVGVYGELYIGGAGLARGYLRKPTETAERFIPDRFSREGGGRLYKTGDVVRYRADGNLEFVGRADHQVKIRGHRIELGEIEEVLRRCEGVGEVVVVAREDNPGDKRLAAYIVPDQHSALTTTELDSFAKEKLPGYMLPSAFVFLNEIPLTPNRKINRKKLPAPTYASPDTKRDHGPRNLIEEMTAEIWAEVLGLEEVGIYENFFDLGGHSLLAAKLVSRLRKTLHVELPLRIMFEKPTVAELAEKITAALKSKSFLMAPPIRPIPRDKDLRLSFAQQRLWFLDQFAPGSYAYNVPGAMRLKGNLDVGALEQTFNEIIRRHEVLRTTFDVVDGQPIQVVRQNGDFTLPVIDLAGLTDRAKEVYLLEEGNAEARQPFDLRRGPLLRGKLLRLSGQEHRLFVTMHHIVSDAWSLDVLLQELITLYDSFSSKSGSPLPHLPIQYADFAEWQYNWLQGEAIESLLSYWKNKLGGDLPILQLPTDHPRSTVQSTDGAKERITIPLRVSEALKSLSRSEGSTLFMSIVAAFKILLHRYSGQGDIIVGTPIANRNHSETENLIGFFVNTLVLRTNVSGRRTVREFLRQVRESALDAYTHQDLPFERLVEELQPDRDMSRNPLFQAMVVLQNSPIPEFKLPSLTLSPLESSDTTTKFLDLILDVVNTEQGLDISLQYSKDLFKASTIARMLGHFQTILNSMIADPDRRISELDMLTEAERQQMLFEWNDTQVDYALDSCVHEMVEASVEKYPDAIAIVFGEERISYKELNTRANQLGHYLQKMGVKPEVLVGICAERSVELIVGMLGILKAGGAYVAMDPEYPTGRLASMLEDAQVSLLLSQQRLLDHLPSTETPVICLDRDWQEIARERETNLESGVSADSLAIVLYTSGSTGQPKGVMMSHRQTCNHMFWVQHYFPLTEGDSMTVKYSICFDASVFEIFYPLNAGATLVIVPQGMQQDLGFFVNLMIEHKITAIDVPTPQLQVLLEDVNFLKCNWLKRITCASDSMLGEVKERYFEMMGAELIHMYGPCEASIGSTFNRCKSGGDECIVTVGKPVSNTQIYILDSQLNPLPVGLTGEIYIGGVGITRGYLNKPDVTAEKFVPDPFGKVPGARLYRTGDRGRYRDGGDLEFCGRIDDQVKIRGFRIELGDIEAAIMQHPHVKDAVVIARTINERSAQAARSLRSGSKGAKDPKPLVEKANGVKRLVAFFVPEGVEPLSESELRSFLAKKLPDYMVPSAYAALDALPLTPSGKIDRRALPTLTQAAFDLEGDFVAPRNAVEEVVTAIWSEVLEVEQISVHTNFFKLGGHSLAAAQVVYRVRDLFNVELPVRCIFEGPTVAELSQVLIGNEARSGQTEKIALAYKKILNMSHDEMEEALERGQ